MKQLQRITPRSVDFAEWYTNIVTNAKLIHYTNVKGAMVFQPNGWAIWESIKKVVDEEFANFGVLNLSMPTLIAISDFQKEKDHIDGFAPELYTVTKIGTKVLDEPYVIRPTSEILFCNYFRDIVNSYNDLPLKVNQWCSVMRAEKTTKPFLRNTEFHWQELHAIFADDMQAKQFALDILDLYEKFAIEYLCIPVIKGEKTPWERFAGAKNTYTIEALMQDGQALQSGTSHFLGDGFAKPYNIKFQSKQNKQEYVSQMSAGISTRIIGALIMVHADDRGLVLPPKIAPTQISLLSILPNKNPETSKKAVELKNILSNYRISIDDSDKGIGFKLAQQEIQGTPISIIIGKQELDRNEVTILRRDTLQKQTISLDNLKQTIDMLMDEIKQNIYNKAKNHLQQSIVEVRTINELKEVIAQNKIAKAYFDGTKEDDEYIKQLTNASSRCIFDTSSQGTCFVTNKKTNKLTLFARAY